MRVADTKLHLGCGKRYLPGYVHVDLSDYDHIDYVADIRNLSMVEDSSVQLIYASHVIEYFDKDEVVNVLKHWNSKLMPGGILRVAVPDAVSLFSVYSMYMNVELIQGPIFGIWNSTEDCTIGHKRLYDYKLLARTLKDAGFYNVANWDWKKVFIGDLAGFDDYSQAYIPHMDKENGILISLNIEATKSPIRV